jgi:uncharacterized iron-regulated membrane protein
MMPDAENGAFVFQGDKSAILVRPRANAVWTAAASGAVRLVADGRDLSVHQRISEMADPLHFGTFGGYWSKFIWFLFGALLTALAVSGVALYGMRLLRTERRAASTASVFARAWAGMGPWRWPALALIIVALVMIPTLFGAE